MDRKDAPENLKWDLTEIYKTHQDFEKDFEKLKEYLSLYEMFKGQFGDKEILLNYFKLNDKFGKLSDKLGCYVFLSHDVDLDNDLYLEDREKLNNFSTKMSEKTAYIGPELAKLDESYLKSLFEDERFKDYNLEIESILDNKKHILSEIEEKALATTNAYSSGFDEIYEMMTESEFEYKPVVINGKEHELRDSTFSKYIKHADRNVRTQAYNNLYKVYNQFSKTISINYINFVKMINSDIKLRKYKTPFEMCNGSKMPEALFENLLKNIDKKLDLEKEYFALLKNALNVKDFGFQDVYMSLANNIDKKYTIDEQKKIVLDALAPLGEEYQGLLKKSYENRWIDFCTNKNKASGGYMLGDLSYIHPFVLLNDNGNYGSLTTLAHELGHAMHSYYSDKTQPYSKKNYATFIAEIASTVNEILLNKYLLAHAKTDEEKLFYLDKYLQNFKATVFRQVMFAEFEHYAHNTIAQDGILSGKLLDNKYKELLKKHFGDIVKIDENITHEWLRIPHFYRPYYVYKYATSYISAVYIANSILENKNDMLNRYRDMLKSGGNDYAVNILAKTGIDLTKDETYEYSFADMKKALDQAKELVQKINAKNKQAKKPEDTKEKEMN